MLDPTHADVKLRFPEFTLTEDSVVDLAIATALKLCGETNFETILYAAAHILAVNSQNTGAADGGSGIVSMEILGPRTVQYQNMAKEGDEIGRFFEQSSYGRTVLMLEKRSTTNFSVMFVE